MNDKIQRLLQIARRQKDSADEGYSSTTSATRNFSTDSEAENVFNHFKEKLFCIERWNEESEASSFALFDERGNSCGNKRAALGDFIKITLPGSGKDDWVKIAEIYEQLDEVVLTVQPSPNPTEKTDDKNTTSHFFTSDSTNNFCLERTGAKINFFVIGLSEKPNTENTKNVIETVRNFATANLGHLLGIQKAQWKTFCENFLEIEKEKS